MNRWRDISILILRTTLHFCKEFWPLLTKDWRRLIWSYLGSSNFRMSRPKPFSSDGSDACTQDNSVSSTLFTSGTPCFFRLWSHLSQKVRNSINSSMPCVWPCLYTWGLWCRPGRLPMRSCRSTRSTLHLRGNICSKLSGWRGRWLMSWGVRLAMRILIRARNWVWLRRLIYLRLSKLKKLRGRITRSMLKMYKMNNLGWISF